MILRRTTHHFTWQIVMALAWLLALSGAGAQAEIETWRLADNSTLEAEFLFVADGVVRLKDATGKTIEQPFENLAPEAQYRVVRLDNGPQPSANPPWAPGYKVRFPVRIVDSVLSNKSHTVIASIPTGGWLKKDVSDLLVTTGSGREVPCIVLSHDPLGETMIQFRRSSPDRWYWVYVHNPQAPDKDAELEARLNQMRQQTQEALLRKTALQKEGANKAATLRDLTSEIERHRETVANATKELAQWAQLMPEREKAAQETAAVVPAAQEAATAANAAHAPLQKVADDKTAAATRLQREAAAAERAAATAAATIEKSQLAITEAQKKIEQAASELAQAQAALKEQPESAEINAKIEAAQKTRTDAETAIANAKLEIEKATAAQAEATRLAAQKKAEHEPADKEAQAARLAAAPTAAAKAAADAKLAELSAAAKAAANALTEARNRVAAATKLKNDSSAALVELEPKLDPARAAAEAAAKAAGESVQLAARLEAELFDFAAEVDPRLYKEGFTAEYRQWEGDKLGSWAEVVDGLRASDNILGSAMVDNVLQNVNPFRRRDPRNFAASYRGFLKIEKPGVYSFFVNGDDASFLFINGYRVYSRTGSNAPLRGRIPIYSVGADIMLEEGVHPFELHHIVGNTHGATGLAALAWIPPGAKTWGFVPREAYVQAMMGIPTQPQAFDGGQVAVFEYGVDDALAADGMQAFICDFQALGQVTAPDQLKWSFGDNTSTTGGSVSHVYFAGGDMVVSLQSRADLPPFRRRCQLYVPVSESNPHALAKAVDVLGSLDLTQLDAKQLSDVFLFLRICHQPHRWAAVEKLTRHLLTIKEIDLQDRMLAHAWLLEAMAQQGRAEQALQGVDAAVAEIGHIRTLKAQLLLRAAGIARDFLKDYQTSGALYQRIIAENRRLRHPVVRQTAIEWGDMYLDAGSNAEAADAYRLANELGSVGLVPSDDPVKRGALLRVAEQQLKEGNIRQTQRLLERIEAEFPEQKLEGLYRYLRGEARRNAGLYEQAIRDYEVLLQMRQWAGYRANAVFGITDSYYRMGDYAKAKEWLDALRESYPHFLAQRGLSDYPGLLASRIAHLKAMPPSADGKPATLFSEYASGFEPGEPMPPVRTPGLDIRPVMGIQGAHTGALIATERGVQDFLRCDMKNLPTQGSLWVELWYRDRDPQPTRGGHRAIIADSRDDANNSVQRIEFYPEPTFGQWHKASFRIALPRTTNGALTIELTLSSGYLEIDGLRVRHVSDAQEHALRNFIEGADPQ